MDQATGYALFTKLGIIWLLCYCTLLGPQTPSATAQLHRRIHREIVNNDVVDHRQGPPPPTILHFLSLLPVLVVLLPHHQHLFVILCRDSRSSVSLETASSRLLVAAPGLRVPDSECASFKIPDRLSATLRLLLLRLLAVESENHCLLCAKYLYSGCTEDFLYCEPY